VADLVITAAEKRKDPTIAIPVRALSNIEFNERKGLIEMGKRKQARSFFNVGWPRSSCRPSSSPTPSPSCSARTSPLAREIYYRTKHTIKDSHENTLDTQDESDPIIEDLEVTLTALREELHVRAENAGSIVGPVVFVDDGDRVDCTRARQGRVLRCPPSSSPSMCRSPAAPRFRPPRREGHAVEPTLRGQVLAP